MNNPIQWTDRPCNSCAKKLGCPHSLLAGEFQAPAPAWLQSMFVEKVCKFNVLREE